MLFAIKAVLSDNTIIESIQQLGPYYQVIKQITFPIRSLQTKPEDGPYHSLVLKTRPADEQSSVVF